MPKLKDIIVITKNKFDTKILAIHKITFSVKDNMQIEAKIETITDHTTNEEIIEQKVGD